MQSGGGPTVIQVTSKSHPIIHHNNTQHVIVSKIDAVTIPDSSSSAQIIQAIYPSQYIDQNSDQSVYSSSSNAGHIGLIKSQASKRLLKAFSKNGSGQYQEYAPVVYTSVSSGQAYYQTNGQIINGNSFSGGVNGNIGVHNNVHSSTILGSNSNFTSSGLSSVNSSGAQIVNHHGTTYLIQSGKIDEDTTALSHTAKASPVTVQWLMTNYETADGVSLPRSTLYFHYLQHCHEHKLEPMNPASFGKLIRSVFLGLRTRRLGTRGNSKYHYYGIRIKPSSHLNHYVEDNSFYMRHYPGYQRSNLDSNDWKVNASDRYKPLPSASTTNSGQSGYTSTHSGYVGGNSTTNSSFDLSSNTNSFSIGSANQHHHAHYLGETSSALPNLEEICKATGLPVPIDPLNENSGDTTTREKKPDGISDECHGDLSEFAKLYADSAADMLDAVVNLDFSAISNVWKIFWRTDDLKDSEYDDKSVRNRVHQLVNMPQVQKFIRLYDHTFYQSLAEVLIPNVLRPIPPTLTQAIRNFAKSLEGWMRCALNGLDPVLVQIKVSAVCALAQTLRRYTSLNHLAQAARAVLKNVSQITQMLSDLNRVDFNNVQEQASWVCMCSDVTINQVIQDFKRILQKQASLEEWAQWLDSVVNNILQPVEGNSLAFTKSAHQLMLKWSFYSSMVIRDLTLRSAASFGSFHLIRLLYDEYIFYLIEHKVAAHWGMTPVAVMGEIGRTAIRQRAGGRRKAKRVADQAARSCNGSVAGRVHDLAVSGMGDDDAEQTGNVHYDSDERVTISRNHAGIGVGSIETSSQQSSTEGGPITNAVVLKRAVVTAPTGGPTVQLKMCIPENTISRHVTPSDSAIASDRDVDSREETVEEEILDEYPGQEVEEEEVEDLEECENEEDENMGEEHNMLLHAHAQALGRRQTTGTIKVEEEDQCSNTVVSASNITSGGNNPKQSAAVTPTKQVSFTKRPCDDSKSTENSVIKTISADGSQSYEYCTSPPAIVVSTPSRKVVRVTTFEGTTAICTNSSLPTCSGVASSQSTIMTTAPSASANGGLRTVLPAVVLPSSINSSTTQNLLSNVATISNPQPTVISGVASTPVTQPTLVISPMQVKRAKMV